MVFDLTFIIIICWFAIIGYRKGMLYSLFSIFGITLALFLSYLVSPVIINMVCKLLNSGNNIDIELDSLLHSNINILTFANYVLSAKNFNMYSISLYALIIMASYFFVLLIIKSILGNVARICYYGCSKKITFAKCDRFLGVFCGTIKGLIFVFMLSIVVIIAKTINIFDNNVIMQISNSSLIDFSYCIFNFMIK